jgi:hypothetical protein
MGKVVRGKLVQLKVKGYPKAHIQPLSSGIFEMKLRKIVGALTLSTVAMTANALTYFADVDLIMTKINEGGAYSSNFNLVNNDGDSLFDIFTSPGDFFGDGYDPLTQTLTAAWAVFLMTDDEGLLSADGLDMFGKTETVEIFLGSELGTAFGTPTEVGITFSGGTVGAIALSDLDEDGILDYSVRSTKGHFVLVNAGLKATFATRTIPDGGLTLILLGLGLFSLAIGRRLLKTA